MVRSRYAEYQLPSDLSRERIFTRSVESSSTKIFASISQTESNKKLKRDFEEINFLVLSLDPEARSKATISKSDASVMSGSKEGAS